MRDGFSRRALLLGVAAGSAAALAPAGFAIAFAEGDVPRAPLDEFSHDQVTILGERQKAQIANVRSVLLGLDEDSLLKPFRAMSGMPAPGASLGGWYEWKPDYDFHHDDVGFAPGHCFGQWVSGMARLHASTGDVALGEKAVRLNAQIAVIATTGDLPAFFAQTRFAGYTYDKLLCGLMDGHRLAGDREAFSTLDQVTAAALPSLPGHAIDHDYQGKLGRDVSWMWDETYTMPENLYLVSGQMVDPAQRERYRTMAKAYLNDATVFAPLARGENSLSDRHAYSYVNSLCSAMQAYLTGGSAMHLDAGRNAFRMIEQQSFATGGWGPNETLGKPGTDALAKSLNESHASFETPCGSYAHMKLTRYLLRATRDGRYGDSMERVMLNTVLGVLPMEPDGRAFYYADYNEVGKRVYSGHRWPCCAGTLPQVVADYGINTYLHEAGRPGRGGAVWVNLYQPSTLRWREGAASLTLEQTGAYVEAGEVRIKVTASQPTAFALRLRIPAWAADGYELRVNGASQRLGIGSGAGLTMDAAKGTGMGFVTLDRTWHSGDVVDLRLPLALRVESLAGHPDMVALMWGPLVLFAVREPGETGTLVVARETLLGAQRTGPRAWLVKSGSAERTFVPFTEVGDRTYSTYVNTRAV